MEYKEKMPEPFDEDKVQGNIEAFIEENKYTSEDVENAYLNIVTDTNKELLEMIQSALVKGLPMNRIGEIVARMKAENINADKKQNESKDIADKYLAEIHALQLD